MVVADHLRRLDLNLVQVSPLHTAAISLCLHDGHAADEFFFPTVIKLASGAFFSVHVQKTEHELQMLIPRKQIVQPN